MQLEGYHQRVSSPFHCQDVTSWRASDVFQEFRSVGLPFDPNLLRRLQGITMMLGVHGLRSADVQIAKAYSALPE